MAGSRQRVLEALSHEKPDRTPLFEIFVPFHPIYWPICGRHIGTDMAMAWDALAQGASDEEMIDVAARAQYAVCRFFQLDMVRPCGALTAGRSVYVKTGKTTWTRDGIPYALNEGTHMVEPASPTESLAYSRRQNEEDVRREIMAWDGNPPAPVSHADPFLTTFRKLAEADGMDWVYMAEIGAGTGVAFYPPFLLMWMVSEPDLYARWLEMGKTAAFPRTRQLIEEGHEVVAIGGDISCDKGPFISPAHYHELILPVIREHVHLIHEGGAKAVYTSDGNHWAIKEDFFFNSGIDGYKEVDKAAGMTFERLILEGVAERVCIIGNLDARFIMCHGAIEDVRREALECLKTGQRARGGHILHMSHSVHEDVKAENYIEAVRVYREFFGLPALPNP